MDETVEKPAAPRGSLLAFLGVRFRGMDAALLLLVAFLTTLLVYWKSGSKLIYGDNFLRADEGVGFLVTDVLLHGGTLYKDIAYPYGYIPAYLHAMAARNFGNTIATYLHVFLVIDVAVLALLYLLLRKVLRPWPALLFAVGAMIPQTIVPGSVSGAGLSNLAYPLERIPLLCVALLWRESGQQRWWRALLIGVCLGGMQGIKFGTGIVAGMALALVELFFWYEAGFNAATGWTVLRNGLSVLGGFLLLQGIWIAVTLASLPPAIARDVLWPTYIYANYRAFEGAHYPGWLGIDYFVGVEMVPLLGVVGSLWWLGSRLLPRKARLPQAQGDSPEPRNDGGILLLFAFFVLASFLLFKGNWHVFSFAWIPMLGGAYLLLQPSRAVRRVAIILWCAAFTRFVGMEPRNLVVPLYPLTLDDGEQLWLTASRRHEVTTLVDYLRSADDTDPHTGEKRPVVFYPLGAGYHVFFHLPHGGRNSWYSPGLVRPYDEARIRELIQTARWVVRPVNTPSQLTLDPAGWTEADKLRGHTFDAALRDDFKSQVRLEREIDGAIWIFSHPQ